MTTAFQDALDEIKSQQSLLENRVESVTRTKVIDRLLSIVGWNSYSKEFDQEQPLPHGGRVDYALNIGDESRVFIEAKQWNLELTSSDEEQLLRYCNDGKPYLAALTNGHKWQLYFKPQRDRKARMLKQFLVFDIMTDERDTVEEHFKSFLAHKSIKCIENTVKAAHNKEREIHRIKRVQEGFLNALDRLTTEKGLMGDVIIKLLEEQGIKPTKDQLDSLLDSIKVTKEDGEGQGEKPISFTLGKAKPISVNGWADLKYKFCELLYKRNRGKFSDTVLNLDLGDWFCETDSQPKGYSAISDSGISIKHYYAAGKVKDLCSRLMHSFGYSANALTIQEA